MQLGKMHSDYSIYVLVLLYFEVIIIIIIIYLRAATTAKWPITEAAQHTNTNNTGTQTGHTRMQGTQPAVLEHYIR